MAALANAGIFLVATIFGIYITILLARVILQATHANYYNPIILLILKVTDPIIKPFRHFIPGYKGIDLAIVFVAFFATVIKIFLLLWLRTGHVPLTGLIFLWSFGDLLNQLLNLYFFAILIRIILSWIQPHTSNPLIQILIQITEPIMAPARRIIPPIAGLDFSPIVVLFVLKLTSILIVTPLLVF